MQSSLTSLVVLTFFENSDQPESDASDADADEETSDKSDEDDLTQRPQSNHGASSENISVLSQQHILQHDLATQMTEDNEQSQSILISEAGKQAPKKRKLKKKSNRSKSSKSSSQSQITSFLSGSDQPSVTADTSLHTPMKTSSDRVVEKSPVTPTEVLHDEARKNNTKRSKTGGI